jgi:Zn-dependent peptidase ImmA (M78 family)/transcriptional regulator with XRE-family HTH domain
MMPGTPGFVGARLREAREARGLTIVSLAEMLGVTKQAVSQYEHGQQTPRPEVMTKLVAVLNLPQHFFSSQPGSIPVGTMFYRSLSAATKTARTRAEWRYIWSRRIAAYLEAFVQFPAPHFPDLDPPANPQELRDEDIEDLATRTRRFWTLGDGPISNMVWLLENNGAIVTRDYLQAETLDAFSEWSESQGRGFVFLGADKGAGVRSRYDCAHELGHLLLHRSIEKSRLAQDFKLIEHQAHRFAGAFLLPAATFADDLYTLSLDSFRVMKTKWHTSIAMMIMRAATLDFVSEDQKRRLFVSYSHRGWRRQEPLDDKLEVETPRVMRRAFELLFRENVIGRDSVLEALPYAAADIERLAALPEAFLMPTEPSVTIRPQQPGNVIPFRPKQA